jgi:CheY-like chemotaxis protein
MTSQPQAFLSYTRVDDEFFGGAITSLRRLLELGVKVVTGDQSFKIFQDIDGIEFGQQWQKELDKAIAGAKFLIPIVTPCFLRSDACRDELDKFIKQEEKMGRDDLVLPIYFITTPSLEKSDLLHSDSLALEISRRQRYDWRSQADLPITDPQVRRAVRELSEKIAIAIARTEVASHHITNVDQLRDKQFEDASERIFTQEKPTQSKIEQRLILWVDDNPDNNTFERKAMESYNIKFILARSTKEALDKIESTYKTSKAYFDVIISDMGRSIDREAGFTLLDELRAKGNRTPYFIYCGPQASKLANKALLRGAQGITNVAGELIEMVLASLGDVPKKR